MRQGPLAPTVIYFWLLSCKTSRCPSRVPTAHVVLDTTDTKHYYCISHLNTNASCSSQVNYNWLILVYVETKAILAHNLLCIREVTGHKFYNSVTTSLIALLSIYLVKDTSEYWGGWKCRTHEGPTQMIRVPSSLSSRLCNENLLCATLLLYFE